MKHTKYCEFRECCWGEIKSLKSELELYKNIAKRLVEWDDCKHSDYEGDYVAEIIVTLAMRALSTSSSKPLNKGKNNLPKD